MRYYSVYNKTLDIREQFTNLSAAKKWMKDYQKQGHEVCGSITQVWASGEWEPLGAITLTGNNKKMVANTRAIQAGY